MYSCLTNECNLVLNNTKFLFTLFRGNVAHKDVQGYLEIWWKHTDGANTNIWRETVSVKSS